MKHFGFGGLLTLALAGSASAADMPAKAPAVYRGAPVQAFSWTGCYAGGHAGALKNDSQLTAYPSGAYPAAAVAAGTFVYDANDTSLTAGVQYGCNKQFGNLVLGLDSSFSWAGINETINASHPAGIFPAYSESVTQQLDWYSTTRARIGWAQDRWMGFIAGGLATGRVESVYFSPNVGGVAYAGSESKNRYGWTVGAGVEYAFNQNWFLRGEYLYVDLGKYGYTNAQTPPSATLTWGTEVDTKFHVARVAISYRFTGASSLLEWGTGGFR